MQRDHRVTTGHVDWDYVSSQMGKQSDRKIAAAVGVSVNTIRRYREKHGITPFRVDAETLPERYVSLLGTMPDQQIADMANIPVKTVSATRRAKGIDKAYASRHDSLHATRPLDGAYTWTAKTRALLGKFSDEGVGKLLGLSKTPVRKERERLGIKPFRQGVQIRWTQKRINMLGAKSDPEVARELGVSVSMVRNKRHKLGIAAFSGDHPC